MSSLADKTWLENIINHVFLPPQLPGQNDNGEHDWDSRFTSLLADSLQQFCTFEWSKTDLVSLEIAFRAVKQFNALSLVNNVIPHSDLAAVLDSLKTKDAVVPLYVMPQNAGVIIRSIDERVFFEMFELAPTNEAVFATEGRLQRQFPATTVSLARDTLSREGICETISTLIGDMSKKHIPDMQPKISKANELQWEDRDTVKPHIVTELLTATLRSFGELVPGRELWKNTREEVRYESGNRLPWRRSPVWLLIRVMLQLTLADDASASPSGDRLYKKFMVYFMAQILKVSLQSDLASDAIYVMNAKIARRLHKLDVKQTEHWMLPVCDTMRDSTLTLKQKWQAILKQDANKLQIPDGPRPPLDQECKISLSNLEVYLDTIQQRATKTKVGTFKPSSRIMEVLENEIPSLLGAKYDAYGIFNLVAFENWVTQCLPTWIETNLHDKSTCSKLSSTIKKYFDVATNTYSSKPEGQSIMILTILELWVACDKSAVATHPLLSEYDPEVPIEPCSSLLLRFRSHMVRLSAVERYIQDRQRAANHQKAPIFTTFGTEDTFAARFYDSSTYHQDLLNRIVRQAQQQKEEKRLELNRLKCQHDSVVARSEALTHKEVIITDRYGDEYPQHRPDSCWKCLLLKQAANMMIQIHEWPLPKNHAKAKAVVFELDVPQVFQEWRDCTYFLRKFVLGPSRDSNSFPKAKYSYPLNNHVALTGLLTSHTTLSGQRVAIASHTKPNTATHRAGKKVSLASESDVCLDSGMNWLMFDQSADSFIQNISIDDRIAKACTFLVSPKLQAFLRRPWHSPDGPDPNEVIASQSSCPDNLSLDEFKALCSLPLGHKIIWENLLMQFAMPSVDWRKVETALFVWQISHQTGPSLPSSELRASHKGLDDEALVWHLVDEMTKSLNRLKENWESVPAVATFVMTAARLLSLAGRTAIQDCLTFLSSCRTTCFVWLQTLREKASFAKDNVQLQSLTRRILQTALVCIQTFDIDAAHLRKLLEDHEALSIFIQCCIAVEENFGKQANSRTPADESFFDALLTRHHRLLFRTKKTIMTEITSKDNLGLDYAIQKIWPAYRRAHEGCWTAQESCWLQMSSSNQDRTGIVEVHYNVITAALLVKGTPLGRLPPRYEHHKDYSILFGRSSIQVMPSAEAGMDFSARCTIQGYQIHLSYDSQEGDLLVRACQGNAVWELVPSRFLQKAFPQHFVDHFVHWYNAKSQVVEFRTHAQPWKYDDSSWRLKKHGYKWVLQRGQSCLVDPSSKTALWLSKVFSPLEEASALHIFFDSVSHSLVIDVPRLQLEFSIKKGSDDIMSRQYRGMRVDPQQAIGTLIGLVDKLVLVKVGDSKNRLVLIPDWAPDCRKSLSSGHVILTVPSSATRVQTYQLNHHLHCLTGNGSLKSKLFLVELHALTSGLIEDPFTHHTGTEEALNILRSQGVRSFTRLTKDEIKILMRIAKLSPGREFYPDHIKVMQVVSWDSRGLSSLSQHVDFRRSVRALFNQASKTSFFYKDFIETPNLGESHLDLEGREAIRSSTFYKAGFGAESHTTAHDISYKQARDRGQSSQRTLRVTRVAAVFNDSEARLPFPITEYAPKTLYKKLTGIPILSPQKSGREKLSFDAKWVGQSWIKLKGNWGGVHSTLDARKDKGYFSLLPWMVSIAFSQDSDDSMLSFFVGLIFHPENRVMVFPSDGPLRLDEGYEADTKWIKTCVESSFISFEDSNKYDKLDVGRTETRQQAFKRQRRQYESAQKVFAISFVNHVYKLWPGEITVPPDAETGKAYVRFWEAMNKIRIRCKSWHNNRLFLESLERICASLRNIPVRSTAFNSITKCRSLPAPRNISRQITLHDLLALTDISDIPGMDYAAQPPDIIGQVESSNGAYLVSDLGVRIARLAKLPQEVRYAEKLTESIQQLGQNIQQPCLKTNGDELVQILVGYHKDCSDQYDELLAEFQNALSCKGFTKDNITSMYIAEGTVVWPTVSPRIILQQMNRLNWKNLSDDWRQAVVNFGCCLAQLQGAERLLQLRGQEADLAKELSNLGQRTWDPVDHPDSLLLEVEGNLRIRKVQHEIAEIMECPPDNDNKNVVMQLNMGEGKSSVIVPVVAAALGDGCNLVRIIVGKPQSRQMFETLVSKLGGLVGRRVYHMPFSRNIRPSSNQALFLERHYEECRLHGGVLLLQPENMLSFQLMVLEAAIKGQAELSDSLLRTQVNFFDKHSRDIIDESDENFSVKFELIYTMGLQSPIDYAPERWVVIQQILGLVSKYALKISERFPKSIEVNAPSQDRCPRIRFLDQEASHEVQRQVVNHICEYGLLPGFPVSRLSKKSRNDIREYISKQQPCPEVVANVERSDFWKTASSSLLLIRGLFAGSIIDFVFSKKRWRVNYGPDSTREPKTRLAVPYRAKDNPSQRSEFSQPEVVILLTSISYYYGGLTDEELFLSFNHLFKSDQADGEYQSWVQSILDLPEAFSQLEGVNITDRQLCIDRLFPHLRYAKGVIDYFLSKIVFVKEMKEFPQKLSASGWDLGRIKTLPATGFSGTNDSQHVLPLTVKQLDLPAQTHTNALVLENLLRAENSVTVLSEQGGHSAIWSAMELLELATKMVPETRVILDVGAQIIDLSNQDVAKAWLDLVQEKQDIQAVVFCDDDDELSVLDRQGQVERLQTSSFAKHLDTCLIFLDEAHTRGIDLRLPQDYRAAVTLGANLVKDRLVQACMRMRKLGHGQSVVFYVPEEIETKIRGLKITNNHEIGEQPITVLDVLTWSISETWADIRRSFPIWATQGNTFAQQQCHWKSISGSEGQPAINEKLAERFLEAEAQSLERRYRPRRERSNFIDEMAQSQDPMLRQIFDRYSEFSNIDVNSSSLQEEQERELAPEVEEERQKERAKPADALPHQILPDVAAFVRTGVIKPSSKAFIPSFNLFSNTSAIGEFKECQWPKALLITTDFARTVKAEWPSSGSYMDDFLRSVQWVLTSSTSGSVKMVVISPYEANKLRDDIASSQAVVRHLYGPRQNQGFAPIDHLDLYTLPGSAPRCEIPRTLIIELNLFAGQLYFRSFEEYKEVCEYLGLAWKAADEDQEVIPDGFIQGRSRHAECGFTRSPVKFLKVILSKIRFNCEGIEKTHLGKVLEGVILTEDDFPDHP